MKPGLQTAGRWLPVGLAVVAVVALYGWIAHPAISQLRGNDRAQTAYYNRLIDGFRAGHLYMAGDPVPAMNQLPNPYDPVQNAPYRDHDATYYQGRYYLYFGVTPALTLFLPYRVLTGEYLWHRQAVAVFSSGLFLVSAGLLVAAWRRYFPAVRAGLVALAVAGLGLANTVPILLRRPDVWEVPIACAAFFGMLTLAALWRAVHHPEQRGRWTLAASLAFGLALGARPSLLPAACILLMPAAWAWWREGVARATLLRLVAGAVGPVTLIGLGLLWYNWARFGDPFQFGQKYQLAGVDNTKVTFFGLARFWYNLRLYLWEPGRWSSYFPFVVGITPPPPPPGHLGVESPFGLLVNTPFVWLGLAAPLLLSRAVPALQPLRGWLLAALGYTAIAGLTVCLFGGACNRYFVDFLPPWILAAGVGVLALEHRLTGRPRLVRWPARALWIGVLGFSMAWIFFSSCEHLSLLRQRDPESYARLARFFNRPVAGVERWLGVKHGPVEFTLRFPAYTGTRAEPLLVSGTPNEADYLWVGYMAPGVVRFGMEHKDYGGPVGELVQVEPDRDYRVVVQMRSLYPPEEHPYWQTAEGREVARSRDAVIVQLDGRAALLGRSAAYEASPRTRFFGYSPYAHTFGARFTGAIRGYRTLTPPRPDAIAQDGPARFKLMLPRETPPGLSEPLVQTGKTGRADTLWIRYVDEQHVVLGLDHWGYGGPETPPLAVDRTQLHEVEVRMGSLYPPGTGGAAARRLEVRLNGRAVLAGEQDFHPARSDQVWFGENRVGASTAASRASARILDLQRGETGP